MHYFIPDTNLFLQCYDYEMLDWSLVTDDSDIVIAVPRTVQREIDRHKDGGNVRRAARARKTWTLFAQVLDSDNAVMTSEVKGKTVSLELLIPRIRAEDYPDLNFDDPDDLIVAEALWVKQQRDASQVTLISNDTPAIMTARSQNLDYRRPPDQWKLPPERDERDKTIEELRKQVKVLTDQHPALSFMTPGTSAFPAMFEFTLFPALDDADISILMNEIRAHFPMQADFSAEPDLQTGTGSLGFAPIVQRVFDNRRWTPADEQSIARYQHKDYPAWLEKTESTLRGIHHELNAGLRASIQVTLENKGQQPARSLLVTYRAEGPIVFVVPARDSSDDENTEDPLFLVAPPVAPAGYYATPMDFLSLADRSIGNMSTAHFRPSIASLLPNKPRDPNSFYWRPRRPETETQVWTLECNEFRHLHEAFSLDLAFRPATLSIGEVTASLRCSAHASNVPDQIECILPVRIRIVPGNTMDRVRDELLHLAFVSNGRI